MSVLLLIGIGALTGLTTVLFGFGGGFVTVPVIVWADGGLGPAAAHVAVATSSVVMAVNACIALLAKLYTGAGFPDAGRTLKETAEGARSSIG